MGTFGERLRREREMRGITLEEIAAATKISTRSLSALEQQEFDKLPGGVFNKGFVRAYSRFLGLDEEQAVADYVMAYEADEAAHGAHKTEITLPDLLPPGQRDSSSIDWRRVAGPVLLVALLLVVVGGGGWLLARGPSPLKWARGVWSRHHVAASTPVALAPAEVQAAAPGPAAGTPVTPALKPADPPVAPPAARHSNAHGFVLQLRAHRSSHVLVQADGQEVMNGTLMGAELRPIRARQQVVITADTPSALQYSFNGQPFRLLGSGSGEQTLTFTPDGIQR